MKLPPNRPAESPVFPAPGHHPPSTSDEALLTFYDFPAEHWVHLRTTNPIQSTFATVRLRTDKTMGCGSRPAKLTMVFEIARSAEKRWRRLNGHELIGEVIAGIRFNDGGRQHAA